MIKGIESLVNYFLTPLSHHFKMLHLDANPISIRYLVQSYDGLVNAKNNINKTKGFEHCFCQYLKNNIADIRLIPLDHVTYRVIQKKLDTTLEIYFWD